MRSLVALIVVVACASTAAAQPLLRGTQDLPELPDGVDDVTTTPAWSGTTDFVDLVSAWFEYDAAADEIVTTMSTKSAERINEAPAGHNVICFLRGTLAGGPGNGQRVLSYFWVLEEGKTAPEGYVRWGVPSSSADGSMGTNVVPHSFVADLGAPGHFRFAIKQPDLVAVGDEFANPHAECYAYVGTFNAPVLDGAFGSPNARDTADSKAVYSFVEKRQVRTAEGDPIAPIDDFEPLNGTASPVSASSPEEPSRKRTPTFGILVVLTALAGIAMVRRRFQ